MTARVVLQRHPYSSEGAHIRWLDHRRRGITATDVPAILGLSPWATPLGVWLDKVRPAEWSDSWPMRRGRALEDPLADEWERSHPGSWVDTCPALIAHPDIPWLMCSLDRMAHTREWSRPLEIKAGTDWREWDGGAIPDQYAVQALVQAEVTDSDAVVLFADVAGRLHERLVERQPEWWAETLPVIERWYRDHVVAGEPPPMDPMRDYAALNRVWEPIPGTEVEATDAVLTQIRVWLDLTSKARGTEGIRKELKSQVRAAMGTATTLAHPETGEALASINRAGSMTIHTPKIKEEL